MLLSCKLKPAYFRIKNIAILFPKLFHAVYTLTKKQNLGLRFPGIAKNRVYMTHDTSKFKPGKHNNLTETQRI
jgi:hypothetical protein